MPNRAETRYVIMVTPMMGYSPEIYICDTLKEAVDEFDRLEERFANQKRGPRWLGETIVREKVKC